MTSSAPAHPRALSLQFKLLGALSLGLIIIVLAALAGLGSAWRNLSTEVPPELARKAQAELLQREFRLQVQEWKNVLIRGADDAQRERHLAAFDAEGRRIAELAGTLATSRDEQTRTLASQFVTEHRALEARYRGALEAFAASGYDTQAADALVRGADRSVGTTLDALATRANERAEFETNATSERARAALVASAITTALAAAVLLVVLALWLRRAVIAPVIAVEAAARAVARGDLEHTVVVRSRDEIGRLGTAMSEVTQTLKAVLTAQATMAQRHDAGQISYRMDADALPGAYGQMIRENNTLVANHIQVKLRAIEIMGRYAVGDLSLDMERLPGEKAVITQALDTAKANLGAINAEIKRLAEAAALGDFSLRGDQARYQHDFGEMVGGLNRLMQTTEQDLGEVSRVLQAIAGGNLSARMHGDFHGVFARMRDDMARTTGQLTTIVGDIKHAAQSIQTAAGEIAEGNSDLSRRTEQQAANLEETAASMEELTSTVRQNAEHARQANQLSISAASVASQGGEVVGQVVTTMSAIQGSSRQIAEIISVIDGIAFQTNILALNAAVEAARAGEQGRGFAVVASEVRTLAQRSAGAAKEIKALIDQSVADVDSGAALVRQAGQTMGEIVGSVQRVTDIMADIAAASQEQSAGIEQVNQTVVQMDETTQQNAALVEEASAAARSMEEQAVALNAAVDVFVLDAGRGVVSGLARAA
ncbi:methyl-accepting chemotaxis protein [Stenotrophomonas rhizophila]|uniref:Methyl-accepting chemotaxis protein-1 (Serine sensor receptor) n=1 Tax=Stenotrophomonas rhizophila TaxID=216778 RepID=A0AAW5PMX0_9GAMM|nr:methyl-accepting chemotaxis protein [Stenotrophomonas rhizophila]MCS4281499.1 methyl-accepting chemotaxis protein-1 (serine sensor receptor) [Stenotrophomonas rhizophila]